MGSQVGWNEAEVPPPTAQQVTELRVREVADLVKVDAISVTPGERFRHSRGRDDKNPPARPTRASPGR